MLQYLSCCRHRTQHPEVTGDGVSMWGHKDVTNNYFWVARPLNGSENGSRRLRADWLAFHAVKTLCMELCQQPGLYSTVSSVASHSCCRAVNVLQCPVCSPLCPRELWCSENCCFTELKSMQLPISRSLQVNFYTGKSTGGVETLERQGSYYTVHVPVYGNVRNAHGYGESRSTLTKPIPSVKTLCSFASVVPGSQTF